MKTVVFLFVIMLSLPSFFCLAQEGGSILERKKQRQIQLEQSRALLPKPADNAAAVQPTVNTSAHTVATAKPRDTAKTATAPKSKSNVAKSDTTAKKPKVKPSAKVAAETKPVKTSNAGIDTKPLPKPKPEAKPVASISAVDETGPLVLVGQIKGPNTLRELMLTNARLIPQELDYSVVGFTFSMHSGDKSWGPVTVTGAAFTPEIKETMNDWDAANTTITIDNIRLRANGQEVKGRPITLRYDN